MINIAGIIFFSLLIIDISTKNIASLISFRIPVINNFFYLTYVENYGAAWGIGKGKTWIFVILAVVVMIVLVYFQYRLNPKYKMIYYSISALMAGILGNCLDRIFNGYVVDFLDFIILGYDFPVFNFADIFICISTALLVLGIVFSKDDLFKKNSIKGDKF